MFQKVKEQAKRVKEQAKSVKEQAKRARVTLPVRGTRKVLEAASWVQHRLQIVHDRIVVSCLTSPWTSMEDLQTIWEVPPKTWSSQEEVEYNGSLTQTSYKSFREAPVTHSVPYGDEDAPLPKRTYDGRYGSSKTMILGSHKLMREKAAAKGREVALKYKESLEVARQNRFQELADFLTKAVQAKIGPDACLQDLLLEVCKISLVSWQVATDGGSDPLKVLRGLYPESSPGESSEDESSEDETPGDETPEDGTPGDETHEDETPDDESQDSTSMLLEC